jgi:hypothetical protein
VEFGALATAVDSSCFAGFEELETVILGPTVKSLGPRAFAGCTALKTLDIGDGVDEWGSGCFADCARSIFRIRLSGTRFRNLNGPEIRPAVRFDAVVEYGRPPEVKRRACWARNPVNMLRSAEAREHVESYVSGITPEMLSLCAKQVTLGTPADPCARSCLVAVQGGMGATGVMTADSLGPDGLGFSVGFSVNSSLSEFKEAVAGLAEATKDVLLIHFCGRSVEMDDESYLEFSNGDRFGGASAAEWLSSLPKNPSLKVVLVCESESEGACGVSGRYLHLRPGKSPRGAIGLFPSSPGEFGLFTFGLLKTCVAGRASPRAIEKALDRDFGLELGMETTSWWLFTRPLLWEGVVEGEVPKLIKLNARTGRLMVLGTRVTRALVDEHLGTARKLVLRHVMEVDAGVFAGFTKLKVAELRGAGLVELPARAFENGRQLSSAALPCWLESVSECAFAGCRKLAALVGKGVKKVGREAFRGVGLPSVSIGAKTLVWIGENAFAESALRAASLPATTEVVGAGAFERCKDLEVACLPRRVRVVAKSVFRECTSLRKLTLGDQVNVWAPGCFWGCQGTVQELHLDGEDADNLCGPALRPALAKECVLEYSVRGELITRGGYAQSPVNMLWDQDPPAELRAFIAGRDRDLILSALRKNAEELTTDTVLPQAFERVCFIVVPGARSLGSSTLTDAITMTDFLASLPGQHWKIYFAIETQPADFERWVRHFADNATGLAFIFFAGHGRFQLQDGKPNGNQALVLSERGEEPQACVWTEPTLEELVLSLKKDARSKIVFLTDACHSGGVYGMRTNTATHGLLGLSAALRVRTAPIRADEGDDLERGVFTYCLVRHLKKNPKVTPEGIQEPLDTEIAKYYREIGSPSKPQRLGLETTSTRLLTEPILEAQFDPAWDLDPDGVMREVFDEESGMLTVTPSGILTRAGVMPYRANTRHLTVRCGVRAEGGAFAGFEEMVDADFSDSTLIALPAEPEGGRGFFDGCAQLAAIMLPRRITALPGRIFKECKSLKHVAVSPRVTTVGAEAFAGSGLLAVDLEQVTDLGEACFAGSALREVKLGDRLTVLPKRAFANTKVESVRLVAVQRIGDLCFTESALRRIAFGRELVEIGTGAFTWTDLVVVEVPDSVSVLGTGIFEACGELARAVLPQGTLRIPDGTFRDCRNLAEFVCPPSLTCIGASAFKGCESLVDPGLPASLRQIDAGAFGGCIGLTRLRLPEGIVEIGSGAFQGCTGLRAIEVGGGVSTWGRQVFSGCGQKVMTLALRGPAFCENWSAQLIQALSPACVITRNKKRIEVVGQLSKNGIVLLKDLGEVRWYSLWRHRSRMKAVFVVGSTRLVGATFCMARNIKSINMTGFDPTQKEKGAVSEVRMDELGAEGDLGFASGCTGLTSITLPPCLRVIGENACEGCVRLSVIDIPETVTSIGDGAFAKSTLISVTLPDGVTALGHNALASHAITKVSIGPQVVSWGVWVFGESRRLRELILRGDESCANWDAQIGRVLADDCRITINGHRACPLSGSVLTLSGPRMVRWFNVHGARQFATRITIGRGVTLALGAFASFTEVLDVDMTDSDLAELPGDVNSGMGIFRGCEKLQRCTLSSQLRTIGPYCFVDCSALRDITIPDGVERIASHAFSGAGLERVALPPSLRSIESAAFSGTNLREVDVPGGVETIEPSAFHDSGLERVALPPSLRVIGASAFAGTQLREVDIPDSVMKVGREAFDCPLTKVSLGEVDGREWDRRCFGSVRRITVEYRGRNSRLIPSRLMKVAVEVRDEQGQPVDVDLLAKVSFDEAASLAAFA